MLTLCYFTIPHATLILYYHASMSTIQTSLMSRALWFATSMILGRIKCTSVPHLSVIKAQYVTWSWLDIGINYEYPNQCSQGHLTWIGTKNLLGFKALCWMDEMYARIWYSFLLLIGARSSWPIMYQHMSYGPSLTPFMVNIWGKFIIWLALQSALV